MKKIGALVSLVIVTAGLEWSACGGGTPPTGGASGAVNKENSAQSLTVEQWRAKHEADYRREYVSLAGLSPLNQGANTIGSGPANTIVLPKPSADVVGTVILEGNRVRFQPVASSKASLKGIPLAGPLELKDDDAKGGPDEIETAPGVAFWVHMSGERRTIRVRDEGGDVARSFAGFHWFPIEPGFRVTARFVKDPSPRQLRIPNQLGDEQLFTTEGIVEFTLEGQTVRMRPMTTRPGRLYFIFRDGTSGKETYETARFLYADLKADGTTVLDFNEAYNPPCAFNPFTTCPLPLPENRLTVRILAGEKNYAGAHGIG
jgi:uncharacterized protein (DUF1684 family)